VDVFIVQEIATHVIHGIFSNGRKAAICREAVEREGHTCDIIPAVLNKRIWKNEATEQEPRTKV